MPAALPASANRLRFDRGLRAASWQSVLVSVLLIALVLARATGLHLHSHLKTDGEAGVSIHLADFESAHDAHDGDVDHELQGESALHKLPSFGALPLAALPLLVSVLLLATVAGQGQRVGRLRAAPVDWRHRPDTPPPAAAPPAAARPG